MIKQLFPTDVLFDNFLNYDRLQELTTEFMLQGDTPVDECSKGKKDLFDENLPELLLFKQKVIIPAFKKYLEEVFYITDINDNNSAYKSWSYKNLSNTSNYNKELHNHSGAVFTGVFYILIDDTKEGGNLEIYDPRVNANRGYHVRPELENYFEKLTVKPKTGDMIILPAFLYHCVTHVNKTRISIPVDMYMEDILYVRW